MPLRLRYSIVLAMIMLTIVGCPMTRNLPIKDRTGEWQGGHPKVRGILAIAEAELNEFAREHTTRNGRAVIVIATDSQTEVTHGDFGEGEGQFTLLASAISLNDAEFATVTLFGLRPIDHDLEAVERTRRFRWQDDQWVFSPMRQSIRIVPGPEHGEP